MCAYSGNDGGGKEIVWKVESESREMFMYDDVPFGLRLLNDGFLVSFLPLLLLLLLLVCLYDEDLLAWSGCQDTKDRRMVLFASRR